MVVDLHDVDPAWLAESRVAEQVVLVEDAGGALQ